VPANSVLVAFATNACTATLYGTPQAPRITWHDSLTRGTMNLVGFSTWSDTVTDAYFSGLDVGDAPFYVFGGGTNPSVPSILPVTMVGARHFNDGEVLLLDSKKVSDWSGVFNVSPATGLDFGTELSKATLEVRNDGRENRTVRLTVRQGEVRPGAGEPPAVPDLHYRDGLSSVTNGPWTALAADGSVQREILTGETWRVQLAVDRTKMTAPSGTVYGAILDFRDVSEATVNEKNVLVGGSHMRACVPLAVTSVGPEAHADGLRGLWLATAELDTVTYLQAKTEYKGERTFDVPSGGKMVVRLPVYIESQGGLQMWLLQRFWYGRDTNGVLKVFSGAVKSAGEPLTDLKRLSTPFLPTDHVELKFEKPTLTAGEDARVTFVVGEKSYVNPMYHARHPQHDAKDADFKWPTPSGDNMENYKGLDKPETFSITNTLEFAWDATNADWEAEKTITGTLRWHFNGLRHKEGEAPDGELRAKGRFTMKHLTSAAVRLEREEMRYER